MRYSPLLMVLLLTACGERPPQPTVPMQQPAPPLAAWKPSVHLADSALAGGVPAVALRVTDELLAKDPGNAEALVRRGDALIALGRSAEAAGSYSKAVEIEPRNSRALISLGRVRLSQDPAAAEALFMRVLQRNPNDAVALGNLGVARDMQGHHAAAQEAYRQALGSAPTSVAVQVNLGLSLALSGNPAGAVSVLKPLAAAPDAAPRIRQDLALALAMNGQREEAVSMLGRDMTPEQVRRALDGFAALRP